MNIAITGAAGLVGLNLISQLKRRGGHRIVAFDKHPSNALVLRRLHPDVEMIHADLADPGNWTVALRGVEAVVIAHAQIGGTREAEFARNNIVATQRLLDALSLRGGYHLVHISSSVVNSVARDWYSETKRRQEALVLASGMPCVVLRPTLMFGWFDRKHLGWLARFMKRWPIFPVPGDGRYLRQPLYAGDFCNIVATCAERRINGVHYNISGQERIDYIDLIRLVREVSGARARILRVPYAAFWTLLRAYMLLDHDPPFTTQQLAALVTPEVFEVIDWPTIFGVSATPLRKAMHETFNNPDFSNLLLDF